MSRRLILAAMVVATTLVQTGAAQAAEGLDGAGFGFVWAIPFVGILLSIALGPLLFPHAWDHHHGKIAAAWGLAGGGPARCSSRGAPIAAASLTHTALLEYLPFILLLLALFTTAGGISSRATSTARPCTTRRCWRWARCWRASSARPARR